MSFPDANRPPRDRISEVSFGLYSTNEIRQISVKEINRPESFDELQHPVPGGLYDPALGTVEMFAECASCGCRDKTCPGHIGHIELSLPVYNPVFFSLVFQCLGYAFLARNLASRPSMKIEYEHLSHELLKGTCFHCKRFFTGSNSLAGRLVLAQLRCLDRGLLTVVDDIQSMLSNALGLGVADGPDDAIELDTQRKSRSKTATIDMMEEGFDLRAEELLQKILSEILQKEKIASKEADKSPTCTRNVHSIRQAVVRDFCSRYLFNRRRKCPHCRSGALPISSRLRQVILIGSARKKPVDKKEETVDVSFDTSIDNGPIKSTPRKPAQRSQSKAIKEETRIDVEPMDNDSVQELLSNMVSTETESAVPGSDGRRILSPIEARQHLRAVWEKDREILEGIYPMFAEAKLRNQQPSKSDNFAATDLLFCDVIPVPPSQFRPVAVLEGTKFENRQTVGFRQVLEVNAILKHFVAYSRSGDGIDKKLSEQVISRIRGRNFTDKLQMMYISLQAKVNGLYDAKLAGSTSSKGPSTELQLIGLRQILEKKEGIFRMNMMGKRVNYACRTVITPDPYMDVDGIGIPDIFAWKLTFPTPVNQLNLPRMRQAVVNGPKKYPGANFVVSEFGHSIMINDSNIEDRKSIAKRLLTNDSKALFGPKKVLRHLLPGDYMLLNRQPTLHKPSIMAHKVHILRDQKTLRLNYATCKTYNADFDGDEMNAHLPQDLLSQAECREILNVIHQYLVPKDGTPLSGLIQDHIVSGVLMTLKDKFFSKEDYEFLVLSAFGFLDRKLRTLPPTIWKPVTRWTGKQIVSTVILNVIPTGSPLISLDGKAKTALKNWQIPGFGEPLFDLSDSHVVFRNCELLMGVFDKAHYGPTPYSLVHCCYELYGPRVACNLLSCFSRLFTTYLQLHGFSFGPADLLVIKGADKKRKKILKELSDCGHAVMREVFHVKNEKHYQRALEECYSKSDRNDIKQLDFCMKSQTDKVNDKVNKACLPHGLLSPFPNNALLLMIECGAKGNMVNSMQMSCMLGQIELEGRRPPVTYSGRSLPSFKPYDHSPRAGGFVEQRFLTGVKPQEFFFHCMAGREGLIDTAVKTSRSGYLQRCIIKHLESLVVNYDLTVRDADQSVIQFQYGEDGLDIGKVQFLQEQQLPFLLENFEALRASLPPQEQLERFSSKKAEKLFMKIIKWTAKHPRNEKNADMTRQPYDSAFTAFTREFGGNGYSKEALVEAWRTLDDERRRKLIKKYATRCPDPVAAVRNPYVDFGALPEKILQRLEQMKKAGKRRDVFEEFRWAIYWKGMKALVEPGEAVGLLAAQSIGEPSTQMTLNTFHFAGRGEMNVTLGIPRLREILMTASERITTPAARVPFRSHVTPTQARELFRVLTNIYLEQVMKSIDYQERLTRTVREQFREYTLTLAFTKRQSRPHATSHLTCQSILRAVEKSFLKRVATAVKKVCDTAAAFEKSRPAGRERAAKESNANEDSVPEYHPPTADEDAMSDEEAGKADEDASDAMLRQKQNDENEYMGEEEEQQAVGQPEDEDEALGEEELAGDETSSVQVEEDDDDDIIPTSAIDAATQDSARVKAVMNVSSLIINYEYDAKKSRWCRVVMRTPARFGSIEIGTIVRREAQRFAVQGIPGVQRCLLSEANGRQVLITEGINLQAFFEHAEHLDVNKIYCNHIHVVARTYGIEAALKALIKETQGVFGNYGIVVDYRHLSLVADYMMNTGAYKPFNRIYIGSSTSPFQKMSFETTMKFLKDALEAGESDHMRSTSSSIVAGQMPKVGTGLFDVMMKLK